MRNFLWRYWYAGNRSRLVLALIALAILLVIRNRASYRRLMGAGLVVGLVVVGWLLSNPPLLSPTPLLDNSSGPVVKNGVAAIVVCGNKRDGMLGSAIEDIAPEPRTGGWSLESRGGCDYHYHHPPNAEQRENRQERAAQE